MKQREHSKRRKAAMNGGRNIKEGIGCREEKIEEKNKN